MTKTTFELSLPCWNFTVDELWPDGDAPENPTIEDVERLIEECGGVEQVLRNWNLVSRDEKFDIIKYKGAK